MDTETHVIIVANDEWLTVKFTPDTAYGKEPWAKMDMEAHVMIVANDEWLTVKFTPDLETKWPVVFQVQV